MPLKKNQSLNTARNTVQDPHLLDYGDSSVLVHYDLPAGTHYSADINNTIHALAQALRTSQNWLEIVPAYDSLLCQFDMSKITLSAAKSSIKKHIKNLKPKPKSTQNVIEIPVAYGGAHGPDIDAIQKTSKLSHKALVKLHAETLYNVCMLGFIPGFSFLSEAPEPLHHPRHATPRAHVPAGSIGIAGWQTGIYGLDSPGGWQIIGRTPLKLFDPSREDPFLIKAGDKIQFIPIDAKFFDGFSV